MEEALERVRGGRGRVAGQRPRGAEDEDAAPGYTQTPAQDLPATGLASEIVVESCPPSPLPPRPCVSAADCSPAPRLGAVPGERQSPGGDEPAPQDSGGRAGAQKRNHLGSPPDLL